MEVTSLIHSVQLCVCCCHVGRKTIHTYGAVLPADLCSMLGAAFVIYDGDQKRVLAARDSDGAQDMHWGVTDDGRFMFGSEVVGLKDCNPTATPFPAGIFHLSNKRWKLV